MGLIICHSCGRRRNVGKIPLKVHSCTNCGARDVLTLRGKVDMMTTRTDEDGVDRETARHRTYAGLRMYQEAKNFKPGFVGVKFKEIYGTWPNGETGTPAEPMTHELGLWLKRGKGRYVAARRKEEKGGGGEGRAAMLARAKANLRKEAGLDGKENRADDTRGAL